MLNLRLAFVMFTCYIFLFQALKKFLSDLETIEANMYDPWSHNYVYESPTIKLYKPVG